MKKYRLAKDLPFAKAGAEVGVELAISVRGKDNFLTWIGDPKDLESLIDEGWIEEVKPREFMLHFKKSNGEIYSIQDLTTKNGYNVISKFDGEGVDSIKVREVLE